MRIDKVTAFITRKKDNVEELLLILHPNAGIQIPAGTVEKGESVEEALKREITEETGLRKITIEKYIGSKETKLKNDNFLVAEKTKVYSRPSSASFDWAELRKGTNVKSIRISGNYTQITYKEFDRFPDPNYLSYQITGWVPTVILSKKMRRHFFHVELNEKVQDEWEIFADNHKFKLFWSSLTNLANIIDPQYEWLKYVRYDLGYQFEKTI
ncbi:MAG: NUDIX domain-containing protein [Candidatus Heimdallarchaeota archaeon]|nr:MAG: NUDIX domain-containing protein [Candidatus Heimdallarchaeota archaeon]